MSPLRYPGGKGKTAKLIHSLSPLSYAEYREPFLGSGAVAWRVRDGIPMWLNDTHAWVVEFFQTLRDDDSFPVRVEERKRSLISPVQKLRAFSEALERLRSAEFDALDFLIVNRFACQAMVGRQRKNLASFSSTFRCDGMRPITTDKLCHVRAILRRPEVKLTCGDYLPLITQPGNNCWVYADPTYLLKHHKSPLYEFYMGPDDHRQFATHLRACKHSVLVTNGNSRFIRNLYSGWRVRTHTYTGSLPHRTPDKFKEELVLTNY